MLSCYLVKITLTEFSEFSFLKKYIVLYFLNNETESSRIYVKTLSYIFIPSYFSVSFLISSNVRGAAGSIVLEYFAA